MPHLSMISSIISDPDYIDVNSNERGKNFELVNRKGIPDYLKIFVERKEEDLSWFESKMRLTDIGGIGVIDLQKKE